MANNIQSYVMILKDWTPEEIVAFIEKSKKAKYNNPVLLEAAKIVNRVNNARTIAQDYICLCEK